MAVQINNIKFPLEAEPELLPQLVSDQLGIPKAAVQSVRILRQALDARKKQELHFQINVLAELDPAWERRLLKGGRQNVSAYVQKPPYTLPDAPGNGAPVVVVGLGPGGLFAAYFLAKHGYRPVVLERGNALEKRVADVERFWAMAALDEESNVMFGEGGAGTFSDGKLTTRIKDPRGDVVLETLVRFGAPEEIKIQAKPHIGTDKLRNIVGTMRREIQRLGGQVQFETRLTDLKIEDGRLKGVWAQAADGSKSYIPCSTCILAIGQGARDTYRMLLECGVPLAPKAFAVGVRVEHPQGLINASQHGPYAGHPKLGAAEYRITAQADGRGVYSFCMCPGGVVVASSSAKEQVVTNGMSYHARDGENANAALVVQVGPEDFGTGPLDGMVFQQKLEHTAFLAGGGDYTAPAQRVEDFMKGRKTTAFGAVRPTYRPGVKGCDLTKVLPDFVAAGLHKGMEQFARQIKNFDLPDAVMTGVESRTSAPVRILRGESGESIAVTGLYPVGEGAGYAGGIVSAAVDGMRAAERCAAVLSE